jgi:hypothetical protein
MNDSSQDVLNLTPMPPPVDLGPLAPVFANVVEQLARRVHAAALGTGTATREEVLAFDRVHEHPTSAALCPICKLGAPCLSFRQKLCL